MYVFLMPRCCLVEVDNSCLHDRFSSLYAHLSKNYNLPHDRMILLSDGGHQLNDFHQIKEHDVGENRDNPIYVFVRENTIAPEPVSLQLYTITESSDITYDVLQSHFRAIDSALNADMETVQQLHKDQHLMCFGWFVAQANFEHDLRGFQENARSYWKDYDAYCNEVGRWEANLNKFSEIKERLQSVPLLQSLLPTSSDLTNDAINLYGPPRTLYDWMCHQALHITPRRANAPHLAGPVGSGFHLTSAANSLLDISPVPQNICRRHPSKLAVNTSFSLSMSSSPRGGSGDSSTPAMVPSLESTLVELVEESAARLKVLNDRRSDDASKANYKHSVGDYGQNNSILMVGDELDDQQEEEVAMSVSTGPKLPVLYSKLRDFTELLDLAPRDSEGPSSAEILESFEIDGSIPMTAIDRKSGAPSSQSIPISLTGSPGGRFSYGHNANMASSSSFITTNSCWPAPEEKFEQHQGKNSVGKSRDVIDWRCSRRSFSRHLDNLSKLQDAAQRRVSQVKVLMLKVLEDSKNRSSYIKQEHHIFGINECLKEIGKLFKSIIKAKWDLADVISRLQEQLQNFSSEAMIKDRECVKCFTYLRNISKCSAILDQLQNSPELYIKCLLEILRHRRLSALWSSLKERCTCYYAEFHHNESQRRESLAQELKNHLLADVFPSLNTFSLPHLRFSHPARQASRISLISISSTKRLSTGNKCLSASQLHCPSSSAFRLPVNRSRAMILPSANESVIDRSENSLPSVNETEVRELVTRLPSDLASMITAALEELDAEECKMMTGFKPGGSDAENEAGFPPSGLLRLQCQRQRKSEIMSSQSRQSLVVDASTSTVGGPLGISTEDKEVEADFENGYGVRDVVCDLCPPSPLNISTPPESVDQSSDLYLSIEVSHFNDHQISPIGVSHNSSLNFSSPHGSNKNEEAASSESDSIVAPSNSRLLNEALANQSESLKRLVEQLNSCLPSNLSVVLPNFTSGEETAYVNETILCVNQLISHLEAHKLVLVASISSTSSSSSSSLSSKVPTDPVSNDTTQKKHDQSTECPSREPSVSQTPSASINEGSCTLSPLRNLSTYVTCHNFVFSSFRSEDMVIFIPIVNTERQLLESSNTNDVPVGEDALTIGGGISFWGARSLALLSSAIISSSLAPSPPENQTGSPSSASTVEQWRMLSNDGYVYFLHDDDFAAFKLADLACQTADSAPGRAGGLPQSDSTSETVLPLARRAVPFVLGVFQRKEKCILRKDENRFGLPRNFVFFRVRARPL